MKVFYIDEIIYAKIPTIEIDPTSEFTRIVTLVILHGLYGKINPNSPCMTNTWDGPLRCIKYYPCNFLDKTSISENGYLLYQ